MDSQRQAGANGRLEELERRLDRMEDRQSAIERSRAAMNAIVPPDTRRHLRAAGRENLLAVRSLLDYWIGRLRDEPEGEKGSPNREDIPID